MKALRTLAEHVRDGLGEPDGWLYVLIVVAAILVLVGAFL